MKAEVTSDAWIPCHAATMQKVACIGIRIRLDGLTSVDPSTSDVTIVSALPLAAAYIGKDTVSSQCESGEIPPG